MNIKKTTYSIAFLICTLTALVWSCIEPFSPPEVNSDEKYLVVDGFLNVGNDISRIVLRRTQNTHEKTAQFVETGAKVSVKGETGESYDFADIGSGVYILQPKTLNQSVKYSLSIKTRDGKQYLSENVPVVVTPAIDSLSYHYDASRDAMIIDVNTHDPKNNTRFYKWNFEETYEYRTAYYSALLVDVSKKQIINRSEDISRCWKTINSSNIILGSTVKLSSDIVKSLTLNVVPVYTNKLYIKYSILVKQYGLSREGFEYWTNLSKTTQGTGSLFDPQPSLVTGNIKNVSNPKELVFGYFSASTVATKRIFMSPSLGAYPRCLPPDTLLVGDAIKNPSGLLISYYGDFSEQVLSTTGDCADCRLQGGTTVKPLFWQ